LTAALCRGQGQQGDVKITCVRARVGRKDKRERTGTGETSQVGVGEREKEKLEAKHIRERTKPGG